MLLICLLFIRNKHQLTFIILRTQTEFIITTHKTHKSNSQTSLLNQQIICCWLFSSCKVVESISWEGVWLFWCHIWHCCEKINNYLTLWSHIYISTSNCQLSCQQYIHQKLTNKTQECTSIRIFLLRISFQTRFYWKWSVCPGISNIFNQIFYLIFSMISSIILYSDASRVWLRRKMPPLNTDYLTIMAVSFPARVLVSIQTAILL